MIIYGFVWAISLIVFLTILKKYTNEKKAIKITILLFISALVFSRTAYILFYSRKEYILERWLNALNIWSGGLSFYGGLFGVILMGAILAKKYRLNFLKIADAFTLPVLGLLTLGRIANLMNSEIYGKITNLPWCINFENIEGCRHPIAAYEIIKNLGIALFLIAIKGKQKKDGTLFFSFVSAYSLIRFIIDFWRYYPSETSFILNQIINILFATFSTYILIKLNKVNSLL